MSTMLCDVSLYHRMLHLEGVGDDGIVENLSPQGVPAVKRIKIRWDDNVIPINPLILTFIKATLPV